MFRRGVFYLLVAIERLWLRERGFLEQNPRQEVETPGLPESNYFDPEDSRHQPIPQEIGWDGSGKCVKANCENADTDSRRQLFKQVHLVSPKVLFSTARYRRSHGIFEFRWRY